MSFTCERGEHVEQRAQHRDHSLAGGNLAAVVRRRAMAGVERRHRADRDLRAIRPWQHDLDDPGRRGDGSAADR